MPPPLIRIFSDVHYGDRASRVRSLRQLDPLFEGVDQVVLNGDSLDTRPGPFPEHTAARRAEVVAYAGAAPAPVRFLTGNHDPDFSPDHWLELAGQQVFVVHGDVLFDDIVPWGRDAHTFRAGIAALAGRSVAQLAHLSLAERMAIWRTVAASVPQRHQSEPHPLKYALRFAVDTVWPPTRFFRILEAWRREPALATAFARRQRPEARFILLGHTHRPAIRSLPGGPVIINTGSFTAPFGGYAVDLTPGSLRVRQVEVRGGSFHPAGVIAEFPLANA